MYPHTLIMYTWWVIGNYVRCMVDNNLHYIAELMYEKEPHYTQLW